MLEIVINMLKLVIEGLRTEDKTKVKEAADMDKQVDEIYQELLASLITHIQVVDGKVFGTAYAILINKYIERAGDHVTNIAEEVLLKLDITIPVCGMVKDDHHRTRGLYFKNEEIPIDTHGEGFRLITRVQDETHRFAIEYHKQIRSKTQVHSILDDIPMIGATRR